MFCVWLFMWVIFKVMLCGSFCIFLSILRHLGSMPFVMCWLHSCGMGLYVIMRAYIWRWSGYFDSVGLCFCIWVSS